MPTLVSPSILFSSNLYFSGKKKKPAAPSMASTSETDTRQAIYRQDTRRHTQQDEFIPTKADWIGSEPAPEKPEDASSRLFKLNMEAATARNNAYSAKEAEEAKNAASAAEFESLFEQLKAVDDQHEEATKAHNTQAIQEHLAKVQEAESKAAKNKRRVLYPDLPLEVLRDINLAEVNFPASQIKELNNQKQALFNQLRQHAYYTKGQLKKEIDATTTNVIPKQMAINSPFIQKSKFFILPSGKKVSNDVGKALCYSPQLIQKEPSPEDRKMLLEVWKTLLDLGFIKLSSG